jgi:predicted secreted hydrolase
VTTAPRPTRTSADPPWGCGPAWERPGARPATARSTPCVSRRDALLLCGAALALPARAAPAPAAIVLPRDFGAHPDSRIEWWYVTGSLEVPRVAEPFGFQVTFFRTRSDVAADHPSAFAARQLLFAHAALTDPQAGRLLHDQRIARAGFGIAEASEVDTDLTLRGWTLRRDATAPGGHRYRARVTASTFAFDFTLAATQPVLLQGDAGLSRKGPDPAQTSRYLSEPQLAVSGSLRREGAGAEVVTGRAWLDHEWSDALLAPDAVGWDWVGINLDNGGALTAFRLRRKDGSALWAGGSLRATDGSLRVFGAEEVRFTPLRWWQSPATRARYPVQWQLDTPAGRHEVRARLDAQELDSRASTGTVYWEGLSDLLDGQGRKVGRGYLEMTGYLAALRLG